jgi:hypothetical protein
MATFTRQAFVGAIVVAGLLATQTTAHAQFSYGWTRYGYNPSNPYVAQQQYLNNLQLGQYAIASGQAVPAWLPYVAPYAASGYGYYGYTAPVYNPYSYGAYYGNYYRPRAYWRARGYRW